MHPLFGAQALDLYRKTIAYKANKFAKFIFLPYVRLIKEVHMRFTFLVALLLGGSAAIAQQPAESPKQAASKHYVGISSGFQGPTLRAFRSNKFPYRDYSRGTVTELTFGKRLAKSLHVELGLVHNYRRIDFNYYMVICFPPPGYSSTRFLHTHALSIPIGLRYRSNGTKFRFTGAAHYLLGNLGELSIYSSKTYQDEVLTSSYRQKGADALVYTGLLRAAVGLEYQFSTDWQLRVETQALGGESLFSGRGIWYSPSLNFGLYKHF